MANHIYYHNDNSNPIYLTNIRNVAIAQNRQNSNYGSIKIENTYINRDEQYISFMVKVKVESDLYRMLLNQQNRQVAIGLYSRFTGKNGIARFAHDKSGSVKNYRKKMKKNDIRKFVKISPSATERIAITSIKFNNVTKEETFEINVSFAAFFREVNNIRYEDFKIEKWDQYTHTYRFYLKFNLPFHSHITRFPKMASDDIRITFDFERGW